MIAAVVTIVASALYAQRFLYGSDPAGSENVAHEVAAAPLFVSAPAEQGAPYRFSEPVATFALPDELREISALTVLDDRHLGAVQDEEGKLYVLDQETGEVTAVMPFGPPGDYEGIELASGRLFVLRADGALFEVEGWGGGDTSVRTYATGLGTACNAEGLGFDETTGKLLIACKEDGDERFSEVKLGKRRAVYAFDLGTMSLGAEPVFVIDPDEVEGGKKMKPSALAVHPITGATFVLCSVGMSLVEMSDGGEVASVWDLEASGFEQPEGMAFLPSGDLFIASEGVDRAPVLTRFAYREAPE